MVLDQFKSDLQQGLSKSTYGVNDCVMQETNLCVTEIWPGQLDVGQQIFFQKQTNIQNAQIPRADPAKILSNNSDNKSECSPNRLNLHSDINICPLHG